MIVVNHAYSALSILRGERGLSTAGVDGWGVYVPERAVAGMKMPRGSCPSACVVRPPFAFSGLRLMWRYITFMSLCLILGMVVLWLWPLGVCCAVR